MGILYLSLLWIVYPMGVYTAYLLEEISGGIVYTEYYRLLSPVSVPKETEGWVVAGLFFKGILARLVLFVWLLIYGYAAYRVNKYLVIILAICYIVSTLINFNYMEKDFGGKNRLRYRGYKRFKELNQLKNDLYLVRNSMDKDYCYKLERLVERLLENYWDSLSDKGIRIEFNGDGVLTIITVESIRYSEEYPLTAKEAYIFARNNLKMLEKCIFYLKDELASIEV